MLTDDEIDKLCPETWSYWKTSVRAIEALLLSKLAAAEMPEPVSGKCKDCNKVGAYHCNDPMNCGGMEWHFAADQLRAYGAACAARMLSKEPVAYLTTHWHGGSSYSRVLTEEKPATPRFPALTTVAPLYTRETP